MQRLDEEKMKDEIRALRGEVRDLRNLVNLLLEMLIEEEEEEWTYEYSPLKYDKNGRYMGM